MVAERRRWTPAEDALLRDEVGAQERSPTGPSHRIDWNAIAVKIPGRSNKDCRKRFHNQFAGCVRKGPWSQEEDARLRVLVRKYRCNWAVIAQRMDTRTADQCSKRWHHSLDPELDRRPWTDAENQMLLSAVKMHGTTWKYIQRGYFPARSANNIKNQFTVLSRQQRGSSSSDGSTRASSPVISSVARSTLDAATPAQDLCMDQFLQVLPEEEAMDTNLPLRPERLLNQSLIAHNKEICHWGSAGDLHAQEQIAHPENLLLDPSLQLNADLDTGLASWTDEASLLNSDRGESSPSHVQNTLAASDAGLSAELPHDGSSRITITVEGAAPDTILTVMKILFESNARVEFQRGHIDS